MESHQRRAEPERGKNNWKRSQRAINESTGVVVRSNSNSLKRTAGSQSRYVCVSAQTDIPDISGGKCGQPSVRNSSAATTSRRALVSATSSNASSSPPASRSGHTTESACTAPPHRQSSGPGLSGHSESRQGTDSCSQSADSDRQQSSQTSLETEH